MYDNTDTILVEDGAMNLRNGKDAAGSLPPAEAIEAGSPTARLPEMPIVRAVDGMALPGGFTVRTIGARPSNAYICNETHFRALGAVDLSRRTSGRLRSAFFIHIPYPATGEDYGPLGEGLACLIKRLVTADP